MPAPSHEHASLVASLLQSAGYRNKDKCRPEILQALHHYSGLKPKLDKFTFNDGRCKDLICLFGTIPVPYRNATYNIPVAFWILDTHPSHAPLCYVTPTPDMSIKVSSHVDGNGKIYLPYLHEWDPNNSDILGLIQMCIITFGEQPPVFARPAGAVQQHHPPPRPVYPPQAASNYPGYPPASSGPGYPPTAAGPVYPQSTGPGYPPAGPVYPPNSGPAYPPVSSNNSGYPTPYPPTMTSQSSVESTGTITQEHILMSMRQGVEDKIRQKLSEEFTLKQAIIQSLRETQDGLNKGQNQLRHAIESVDRDYDAMERSIQELKKEEESMKEALKQAEKLSESSEINPEDAVSATTPLYRQLVNAHAEESAVSEAIYYLGEALKQEIIDCDVFLRQVRKMARKQFLLRATMEKARQVAAMSNGVVQVHHEMITYDSLDARTEVKLLQAQLLNEEDQKTAKDLQKYLLSTKEDLSWILDDQVHKFVKSFLNNNTNYKDSSAESKPSSSQEAKIRILRILAICALKENFINFLNLDRKDRVIMNYASTFQDITNLTEQKALAMLICNLFAHPQTSSYALYFSQWTRSNSRPETEDQLDDANICLQEEKCSNAHIVVQLASNCLYSKNPFLIQIGSAIMVNISFKHVKVLAKPDQDVIEHLNEDLDLDLGQANLDCSNVSHSDLSERKGNFVALKAYDEMVVEICSSLWEYLTSPKENIDNEALNRSLRTLSNFVHMLDFADSEMADELRALSKKDNISPNNQELIQDLLNKFSVAA